VEDCGSKGIRGVSGSILEIIAERAVDEFGEVAADNLFSLLTDENEKELDELIMPIVRNFVDSKLGGIELVRLHDEELFTVNQ
jgi:hypothetical protein